MNWWLCIFIPLILGIVWWLYVNGYACYKNKSAATFIGRSGSCSFGASFTACSGKFGRYLKAKEGGLYRFSLSADLSKGSVRGRIRQGRNILAELDPSHPEAVIELAPRGRCNLELHFTRSSGSCSLQWNVEDRR